MSRPRRPQSPTRPIRTRPLFARDVHPLGRLEHGRAAHRQAVPTEARPSGASGSRVSASSTDWHVPGRSRTPTTDETKKATPAGSPGCASGAVPVAGRAWPTSPATPCPSNGSAQRHRRQPRFHHLRFEPLPAPRAVLPSSDTWAPTILRPGDPEEVVVIRSESATVDVKDRLDNGVNLRLLLRRQTSVTMAEQHGAFDSGTAGEPMDTSVYDSPSTTSPIGTRPVLDAGARSARPTEPVSTDNPFLFPDLLRSAIWPTSPARRRSSTTYRSTRSSGQRRAQVRPANNGWPSARRLACGSHGGNGNNWTVPGAEQRESPESAAQPDAGEGLEFTRW